MFTSLTASLGGVDPFIRFLFENLSWNRVSKLVLVLSAPISDRCGMDSKAIVWPQRLYILERVDTTARPKVVEDKTGVVEGGCRAEADPHSTDPHLGSMLSFEYSTWLADFMYVCALTPIRPAKRV